MTKKLLTITGPSGSGKTEVLNRLCKSYSFSKLVSVTTRPPRPGEVDGKDYYFISKSQFKDFLDQGSLAQSIEFQGNGYGTQISEINAVLNRGSIPAVIVEPNGVHRFKEICDQYSLQLVSIYIDSNIAELTKRYMDRIGDEELHANHEYHSSRVLAIAKEQSSWPELAPYTTKFYNGDDDPTKLDRIAYSISQLIKG